MDDGDDMVGVGIVLGNISDWLGLHGCILLLLLLFYYGFRVWGRWGLGEVQAVGEEGYELLLLHVCFFLLLPSSVDTDRYRTTVAASLVLRKHRSRKGDWSVIRANAAVVDEQWLHEIFVFWGVVMTFPFGVFQ